MLAAYPLRHDRPRQHVGRVHLRARGHHGVAPHQEDTSPKTGATLESTMLFPNLSLRSMIRAFNEAGSVASTDSITVTPRGRGCILLVIPRA